jgi:GNAT superfamily N-acetyltransferase
MATPTYFRRFVERDLPALEAMVIALYAEDPPGEPMTHERIARTIRHLARYPEKGRIVIFCRGEEIVGYAIVIHFWSNEFGGNIDVVEEMYVSPQWRGKGIGTAFLSHAASSSNGSVKGLQVEVTPGNQKAYAFYTRNGFFPMANHHLFMKSGYDRN